MPSISYINPYFRAPRAPSPLKPLKSIPRYQNLPGEPLTAHSDHRGPLPDPVYPTKRFLFTNYYYLFFLKVAQLELRGFSFFFRNFPDFFSGDFYDKKHRYFLRNGNQNTGISSETTETWESRVKRRRLRNPEVALEVWKAREKSNY